MNINFNRWRGLTFEWKQCYFQVHSVLYNNQINARALIDQSAMGYCAGKPMGKSRIF